MFFFEATDLHRAVVFNPFCAASARSIIATHYKAIHNSAIGIKETIWDSALTLSVQRKPQILQSFAIL